ncbi:unnamed protein product [Effrenium voratum]|nr:unnamed protein product [Effrenium voratum]
MWDSPALLAEGRTASTQYTSCGAFEMNTNAASTFFAMQRTLATYIDGQWSRTPHALVRPPPPGRGAALASVLRADAESDLDAALGLLCPNIHSLPQLVKVLGSHVLVMMGPSAYTWWRRSNSQEQAEPQPYLQVACAFCQSFCIHGSCEHSHVGLIEMHHISLEAARFPQRRAARQPAEEIPVADILLPSGAASSCQQLAPPAKQRRARSQAEKDKEALHVSQWQSVLKRADGTNYLAAILRELAPADFASLDIPSLRALFPSIPAGPLIRVHRACVSA